MAWQFDENDILLADDQQLYAQRYISADYIEFDWDNNGGWIDIGLPSYTNSIWYADFEYITVANENWIAGGANLSNNVACICGTANGTNWYTDTGVSYDKDFGTGVRIRGKFNANGVNYTAPNNIYLGCRNWAQSGQSNPNNNSSAHFKVYGFYMSQNNVVQRDMRPAYDPVNQEWGMFDTVSNTFFGNAGAEGTSIAGGYYPEAVIQTPEILAFDYDDPPASMWHLNHEEIIVNGLLPEPLIDDQGAFNKCAHLVEVEIPASVTSIGRYSFRETQLKKVKIASNCTYYDTSFPDDCVIIFYS